MDQHALKDSITDAIRYWEPRRVLYNGVLAAIVIAYFCIGLPASKQNLNADFALGIFLLAVVANVAYCAAYIADFFAQLSDFRQAWRRIRWIVLLVGTLFAAIITRFIAMGMFATGR
jgi:hypothetical protein